MSVLLQHTLCTPCCCTFSLVGAIFFFMSDYFTISGYALLMVLVLCQAIGLRHSRLLIFYVRKLNTPCAPKTTTTDTPTKPVAATAPAPVQPSAQYIQMQTLRYPAMPMPMFPMMQPMPQDTTNQLNAPQFYPMPPQFYPYPMPVAPPAPQQQQQQ